MSQPKKESSDSKDVEGMNMSSKTKYTILYWVIVIFFAAETLYCCRDKSNMTAEERATSGQFTEQDVLEYKQGLLDRAKEMNSSLPVQVNEAQTLYTIGVLDNLIIYKYEISNWPSGRMVDEAELLNMKNIAKQNNLKMQQYPDLFVECLRTGLQIQTMFFDEERNYIGGFTISSEDYAD